MSAPDLTSETISLFTESGCDRHVTLLLGAGASTSSGLPGWDELAVRLLLRSGSVTDEGAARQLLVHQDPLLVAEAARNAFGARWNQQVKAALYEGLSELTPSAMHIAVAGHALAGETGDTTLVTLNFDTLLEDAIEIDGTPGTVESRVDADRVQGIHTVHHLHGVVSPADTRDVVLTLSDYNEILGEGECWQQSLLRRSARAGAIVIAGTSYRDPDLRRWLHVALNEAADGNAALVLLAREGFRVSRADFAEIRAALAQQWQSAGLTAVILEDFADAAQIIRELRYVHRADYRSPQERAAELWGAHTERFDRLQPAYADQLHADAALLHDAFGVEELNLTLWLADANGGLARYAAQDRRYRSAADLRHVPSGHDSLWIAGIALGSEEIVIQGLDVGTTSRWGSVLAVPVRVEHSGLPGYATAVLSVGLPGSAETYSGSQAVWFDTVLDVANQWSARLVEALGVGGRSV